MCSENLKFSNFSNGGLRCLSVVGSTMSGKYKLSDEERCPVQNARDSMSHSHPNLGGVLEASQTLQNSQQARISPNPTPQVPKNPTKFF
jgi:hypothetical protein